MTSSSNLQGLSLYLWVDGIVVLLGSDPLADQVIPHRVGYSLVEVKLGCDVAVLHQGVVEMTVEARLD